MNELIKLIEKPSFVNFDHLRISIASPDEIISWSHGEIKKPENWNVKFESAPAQNKKSLNSLRKKREVLEKKKFIKC